jgi:hypothetical protein
MNLNKIEREMEEMEVAEAANASCSFPCQKNRRNVTIRHISVLFGLIFVTYFPEGGKWLLTSRRFHGGFISVARSANFVLEELFSFSWWLATSRLS